MVVDVKEELLQDLGYHDLVPSVTGTYQDAIVVNGKRRRLRKIEPGPDARAKRVMELTRQPLLYGDRLAVSPRGLCLGRFHN